MKRLSIAVVLLIGLSLSSVHAQQRFAVPDARMLRFPDLSAEAIVFLYAGDLWTVPRTGGLARRLTSVAGGESFPKFSPDGSLIAFSGNYDGNTDVYVTSAAGGSPQRLTHHPDPDLVVEWYPNGKDVLYRSRMTSPSRRFNRFFRQSLEGGLPEQLPLPYGELASFSPDGTRMAFQFISREFRTWKRYRGGMASDIWLYDFQKNTSEKFTDFDGTDAIPMWHDQTIYFLSDRDPHKKLNLWAYDLNTKKTRQVTAFTTYDVKWPSLGPDAIVFENGGTLYLLDLATGDSVAVDVKVPADLPRVRRKLKNVSGLIRNYSLSPTGMRGLFEARGEIFTVPKEHGSVRNLTGTSGVAERYPAWSPDGKFVAYFSDRTGEYELYVRPADGSGQQHQITENGSAFRYRPVWSPDGEKLAFSDKTGSLFIVERDSGESKFIDKDEWFELESYNWSPDGKYLAYARRMENRNGAIMIYDLERQKVHQVTSGYYDDAGPVFDPDGKYLFFRSDRRFSPVYGDMDYTWIYPGSTQIFVATLRKDLGSPLAPRSDEEPVSEQDTKKDESNESEQHQSDDDPNDGKAEQEQDDAEGGMRIDFDGFEERVVALPIRAGNIGSLYAVQGKLVFSRYLPAGAAEPGKSSGTVLYYDIEEREEKTVIAGIDNYTVSFDGKKLAYKSGSTYGIIDLAAGKNVGDGKIAAGSLKTWIEPRKEWKQIFTEAWRVQRDFFYDPNMHGLDWQAIKERYAALLPYVVDREDLNYVIGEMIAELNASHTYVRGGDIEHPDRISVGLLGCDFTFDPESDAYRIGRIYEAANRDATVRSPLRTPGIDVNEGDYLLAVNGRPVDTSKDPWAAFEGLAGHVVTLTVGATPDINEAREVTVKPIDDELRLRNLAWIEHNRRKVEQATAGRVGYIYVPDTGRNGQNELVRQFNAQWTKKALVIDERFNSGGQIPDRFIELLNRPTYNYWARRDHRSWQTPFLAHSGPKVMLMNGWSGSGGDALPYYFRKAGLGPLVGTRTWGGLIGISGNPQPIDGGFVSVPTFGLWNTEGDWDVEGYGVDPDYEVENEPHKMAAGQDPQLETAIALMLNRLREEPVEPPRKPVYPDRSDRVD